MKVQFEVDSYSDDIQKAIITDDEDGYVCEVVRQPRESEKSFRKDVQRVVMCLEERSVRWDECA